MINRILFKSHSKLKMDMLSLCRKRHTTTSPETKRRSPRTAQNFKASGAKKTVDDRMSGTDKCLSNIDDVLPAITESQNGNITLRILAKPGAKQSAITDIVEDYIGVQIGAPARESEANIELVNYLASILELRKTNITVVKGLRSQIKSVSVSKNGLTIDKVKNLIEQELSKDIQ